MRVLVQPWNVVLIVSVFLFGCIASANAQRQTGKVENTPSGWTRVSLVASSCTKPPKIDGILDDQCWKNAGRAQNFARLTSPVVQQTEAWACADSTHLYIAFHCFDSHMNQIRSAETQRNGNTWVDDSVSVDIDSQDNRKSYSQFTVTPRGTQNENLEGGTADNITWAGDWRAATHLEKNGWTVEISIPFALLRYPKNVHSFGLQLERKLARETSNSYWPERPAKSQTDPIEYFAELTNISPELYRPKPIFLPYTLLTAGEGNSAKFGMDIKYPLSTGFTGLATINPDFATVEQNVTSISFSYTQKYISDQRPFFAEGSGFFPYSDIFYSPSVGNIDEGLKFTGKENGNSVGLLATNENGPDHQTVTVASISHDLNPLSNVELDYAGNNQAGVATGDVVKASANFGLHSGRDTWTSTVVHSFSWLGGAQVGGQDYYMLRFGELPGHPDITYQYQAIAPNFNTELGYETDYDYKGPSYSIGQSNTFDKGYIQYYSVHASWTTYNRMSNDSFFSNNASASMYLNNHVGDGLYASITQSRRLQYRDHVNEIYFEWSDNSLYGGGDVDYQRGSQTGEQYTWYSLSQGYGVTRNCSVYLQYNWQNLGGTVTTQAVFTPTYRLTPERSIGGRIVRQLGQTDVFLTFAQKARTGADIFLIFGDPNSPTTRGLIQMKVVQPF